MKKIFILTVGLLLFIICVTAIAEEEPVMPEEETTTILTTEISTETTTEIRYTTTNLNYRDYPSLDSNVIGTLNQGSAITIVDKSNVKWYKAKLQDNFYYVSADYLSDEVPTLVSPNPAGDKTYKGKFQLTAYCSCTKCTRGLGITASGTKPVQGRTVGCNGIPLGTPIYIEGYGEYVVEDTGNMHNNVIDVYMDSHSAALQFGRKYDVNVYIIK